eukprot:13790193-Alexandrium_andersonii.AAC.1
MGSVWAWAVPTCPVTTAANSPDHLSTGEGKHAGEASPSCARQNSATNGQAAEPRSSLPCSAPHESTTASKELPSGGT